MDKQVSHDRTATAMIDQTERSGSVKWLLLLAFLLVAAAASLILFKGQLGGQLQLIFLGVLAGIGILSLLGLAVGLFRFGNSAPAPHLTRQFVDSMSDGVLVCDEKGRIVYANAEYARLTGAVGAENIRSIERSFAGDPDAAEAIYRLSEAVRDGRPSMEEFRLLKNAPTLDGEDRGPQARWYRIKVRALIDPATGGQKDALHVWQISDITRDRERQENIFQELQLAINYLDHAPAGFFSAEPDGRVIYMNATLADWLGYDLAQFEPRILNLSDLVSGEGTALLDVANSSPGMPKTEMIDLDLVKRNGQGLPVRLMHRVPMASDGTAGASRTLVLNRSPGEDISEALRVAEVRFARFFNNTPIAIAAVTGEGRVVRTNAPFVRLFSSVVPSERSDESDEPTPTIHDLVSEKNRGDLSAAIEEALNGKSNILPVECELAEDDSRAVRFFLSGVEDSEADEERVIVYALETTEQRDLEIQFTQSQKMQAVGQLAGGVAHDFNNVLTAIIGFSDLLLASHRPSDPAFQDIMNIKQNANRAASLVRQLLAFSRRQTLRPQVLVLGDVLADLSILLDRLLGEKVDLELVYGRDLWPVKADLNQLEQVIVNLAVNARDAMPDGGQLIIQTRNLAESEAAEMPYKQLEPAEYVLLEVLDSGTGIPPDIRDKIFEPFFSTKDVGKGTGLGLSTVYGIIKQTGGFIFLESEMGQGTTFRIFLPRFVEDAKAIAAKGDPDSLDLNASDKAGVSKTEDNSDKEGGGEVPAITDLTGSATILLVEDEEAVRAFAARALASRGYSVHEAGSGAEALELIEEIDEPIDLVVSDVVMPEMDGPTMLGELRKKRPDLKVIFMSGYAEEAFRKNLPDHMEFGFLPKPFSLKQLATKIKEVLEE